MACVDKKPAAQSLKRVPFGLALNDYVAGDGPALFARGLRHGA